jgi:hypothetical protein
MRFPVSIGPTSLGSRSEETGPDEAKRAGRCRGARGRPTLPGSTGPQARDRQIGRAGSQVNEGRGSTAAGEATGQGIPLPVRVCWATSSGRSLCTTARVAPRFGPLGPSRRFARFLAAPAERPYYFPQLSLRSRTRDGEKRSQRGHRRGAPRARGRGPSPGRDGAGEATVSGYSNLSLQTPEDSGSWPLRVKPLPNPAIPV